MFSNDSRWDRHLPSQGYGEEPIDVGAIFQDGKLYPRWFLWHDRKYSIKDITYRWEEKRGGEVLYFFTVSDETNVYHIYFNNRYLHWRMKRAVPLGAEG